MAALLFAAAGCVLDERMIEVQPDPIVLGSFEGGTQMADDPRFGAWTAYSRGPDQVTMRTSLAHIECYSRWCLELEWQITDPADGTDTQAAVGYRVAPLAPIDLTAYSKLVFGQMNQHQGSCPPSPGLTAVVSCEGLRSTLHAGVSLAAGWMTTSIDLAQLVAADDPPGAAAADCLTQVSGIAIQADVSLADGGCASGNLFLDNLSVR